MNKKTEKKSSEKEVFPFEKKDLVKIRKYFSKKEKHVILGLINIGINIALRYSDLSELKFEDISYENTIKLFEEKTNKKKEVKLNKFSIEEIKK